MSAPDDEASASPRAAAEPAATRTRLAHPWILVLVAVTGLGLLATLRFVAAGAPSTGSTDPRVLPTPEIGSDQACTEFARYWLQDSGLDLDAGIVADLANCYPDDDGSWFVPLGRADPRLPQSARLTDDEREATDALRRELLAQIEDLEEEIPSSLERELQRIYDPRGRALYGHVREGAQTARARSRYTRLAQAFLIEPERQALADYVAWYMARRIAAYDALVAACVDDPSVAYLTEACRGLAEPLSLRHPPWTWDLRDSLTLDQYLGELVRTGTLPDAGAAGRSDAGRW